MCSLGTGKLNWVFLNKVKIILKIKKKKDAILNILCTLEFLDFLTLPSPLFSSVGDDPRLCMCGQGSATDIHQRDAMTQVTTVVMTQGCA